MASGAQGGRFPAAYCMSFLAGDFLPWVDITIQTDKARQSLHKDPFAPSKDTVEPATTVTPTIQR